MLLKHNLLLQRHSIGTTSVQYAHWFLKEMSEEVNQVITAISEEQCMLADRVSSEACFECNISSHIFSLGLRLRDPIHILILLSVAPKKLCCYNSSVCQQEEEQRQKK